MSNQDNGLLTPQEKEQIRRVIIDRLREENDSLPEINYVVNIDYDELEKKIGDMIIQQIEQNNKDVHDLLTKTYKNLLSDLDRDINTLNGNLSFLKSDADDLKRKIQDIDRNLNAQTQIVKNQMQKIQQIAIKIEGEYRALDKYSRDLKLQTAKLAKGGVDFYPSYSGMREESWLSRMKFPLIIILISIVFGYFLVKTIITAVSEDDSSNSTSTVQQDASTSNSQKLKANPMKQGGTLIDYNIQEGDTISTIAKRYHLPAKELKKINNLTEEKLIVGDTIRVPQPSQP